MPYSALLTAGKINQLELKHRIITGPMERNLATRDGMLTQRYLDYIEERAKGGAALIQMESTYVNTLGMGHLYQLGAHGDHVIPGLKRAAEVVHKHGASIGLELYMGGARNAILYVAASTYRAFCSALRKIVSHRNTA